MGIADELERLQTLRERGALSQEEFERAKAHVLSSAGTGEEAAAGVGEPGADAAAGIGSGAAYRADIPSSAGAEKSFFRQLARSQSDRLLGGVCGGLGRHTDLPSWAWRLIFCLVTLYFGSGILFYLLLWIFLPLESTAQP
jgi:phage shock protein PspC (stress-responsive transcriptional regulator)